MTTKSTSPLWSSALGIRFSPKAATSRLYPDISTFGLPKTSRHFSTVDSQPHSKTQPVPPSAGELNRSAAQLETTPISRIQAAPVVTSEKKANKAPLPTSLPVLLGPGQMPETSLEFKLSASRYSAARKCAPDTTGSFWSHEMYQRLDEDGTPHNVKVHYCTSKHTAENVCKRYFEGEPILGFDMEWIPYASRDAGPRQNVSLIQIASPSRVALFHIALFPGEDFVSPTFRKLMEDSNVIKVGVNILADASRLNNTLGVNMKGIFELSHLYKLVLYTKTGQTRLINKVAVSMDTQVKECLGLSMFKGSSVRTSNWLVPLSSRQLTYAASDAYAGIQLYYVLEGHRQKLKPCPPRPYFAELKKPIRRAAAADEEKMIEEVAEFSDDGVTDEDLAAALLEAMSVEVVGLSNTKSEALAKPKDVVDARITAADLRVKEHHATTARRAVKPSALRAYYVWHDNDLNPAGVASLLRTPPLQTNTIVSYILDAVVTEKLPYSKTRMSSEVLCLVHPSATKGRYQKLAADCNYTVTG